MSKIRKTLDIEKFIKKIPYKSRYGYRKPFISSVKRALHYGAPTEVQIDSEFNGVTIVKVSFTVVLPEPLSTDKPEEE